MPASGQIGNAIPLTQDSSTVTERLDYQLLARMPITNSSAQNQVLLQSEAGLIVRGAASSGSTVTLPAPLTGTMFWIYFTADATSEATIIRTNSSLVDMVGGGGGVNASTNTGVQLASSATEQGQSAQFIAISTSRWAFFATGSQFSSGFSSASPSTELALWGVVDSTG